MLHNYSDEQLRLAARLYYLDNMPQAEVARFVKVSQAKVSRLLSLARERGIVRISVAEYEPRNGSLETQLQKTLDISRAFVIKTAEGQGADDSRRTLAHFAAPLLGELISEDSIVAVSGGRTLSYVVQALPQVTRRVTIVQAMGNIDSQVGVVDALEIARQMAMRWNGSTVALNTPAFTVDKKTRDAFLAHDQISHVRKLLNQANAALIGIGTLDNSVFVERGVLTATDLEKLKRQGAVGEICGRFFDASGKECDSPWRDRVISVELERLRKMPQVVAFIAGSDRSAAIRGAIRAGLIKTLIIDEPGARALLTEAMKR